MCKRSSFPVVFNFWLALVVGAVMTVFSLWYQSTTQQNPAMFTVGTVIPGIINGTAICFFYESVIDLPGFGNFFVAKFGMKMDGKGAYFVRILFITILLVLLMTITVMFCNVFFVAGPVGFFMGWITSVVPIFIVAYITVLITFPICMAITKAMCTKEG